MSDEENDFVKGDSGALNTELVEAGRRKPGSLLMMKGEFPCKVVSFSTAKPGKHGSAKAMITGKDIFTDKQYEETFGTGDMIPAPVVKKTEYTCIDVNDEGYLMLMTPEGEMKIVENVMANWGTIQTDIGTINSDMQSDQYTEAGETAADVVILALGHIDSPKPEVAYLY